MPLRNILCAAVAALLMVTLPGGAVSADTRPESARLKAIVARHPGDIEAIRKEIAKLYVQRRARDFCVVEQNDRVMCVDLNDLIEIKGELPGGGRPEPDTNCSE